MQRNGGAVAKPNAEQVAAAAQQLQLVLEPIRIAVGTTIRGLLVSCPGVDPAVVVNAVAQQTGLLLASALAADLTSMLMLRKAMKEAFDNGVKAAPLNTTAPAAPPNLRG